MFFEIIVFVLSAFGLVAAGREFLRRGHNLGLWGASTPWGLAAPERAFMARLGVVEALPDRRASITCWRAPTVVDPNGGSLAHARTCRSALRPGGRRPSFWRVVLGSVASPASD